MDHPTDSELKQASAQIAQARATLADLEEDPTPEELAIAGAKGAPRSLRTEPLWLRPS